MIHIFFKNKSSNQIIMKKIYSTLLIILLNFVCLGQQKSFGTKTIGQWSFEKFPLHYSVKPTKAVTNRNIKTKKLEYYLEINEFGQADGLSLTLCADGIHPLSANYTFQGQVVYTTMFFPVSNIAQSITTFNKEGQIDGFKIYRTLKSSGGYKEEIEKYSNGDLIEKNGVKIEPFSITFKDSLLDGKFKVQTGGFVYEGIAENGKLIKIKEFYDGKYPRDEITFFKDSFQVKSPSEYKEGEFIIKRFLLINTPIFTNSASYCKKFGNYNGYPFMFFPSGYSNDKLIQVLKRHFPQSIETNANYTNSLLNGDFQYREYNYMNDFLYEDVNGTATNGCLTSLSIVRIKYDYYEDAIITKVKTDYVFDKDSIKQIETDLLQSNKIISVKSFKIESPVLLTNSVSLGGRLEYDYEDMDLNLNVPHYRKASLQENKFGFAYFSPFTFNVFDFLKIITTKTFQSSK